MLNLNKLPKITIHSKKRLGQGHGSGKGKTGGRGTKGQHARHTNMSSTFSGGALHLVKRLPLIRGKLRNKSRNIKQTIIFLDNLNSLPKNSAVDLDLLVSHHLVKNEDKESDVKILTRGEIKIPLIIKLECSKSAAKKIIAAGGKIELQSRKIKAAGGKIVLQNG